MSLILWITRRQHAPESLPYLSSSPCQKRERKRLQKSPPRLDITKEPAPISSPDLPSAGAPPAYCFSISLHDEKKAMFPSPRASVDANRRRRTFPTDFLQPETQEIFIAELESPAMPPRTYLTDSRRQSLRTRSKTPVFAIGQLEHKQSGVSTHFIPLPVALEDAEILAGQYRSILPIRSPTPIITNATYEPSKPKPRAPRRTLRKIKSQQSLRSLATFPPTTPGSSCSSDAETLVGLDSPLASPGLLKSHDSRIVEPWFDGLQDAQTPDYGEDSRASSRPSSLARFSFDLPTPLNLTPRDSQISDTTAEEDSTHPPSIASDDVGLNICLNLLTDELATAFFRQHPSEEGNRASGLQLLLMIEAYEAVQKQVKAQKCRHNGCGIREDGTDVDLDVLEGVLEQWLEALYKLYEGRRAESAMER